MRNRAVFLDRDGTLIEDRGYIKDPDKVVLLPNVPERIKAIWDAGWLPIVVTNQAAVGYGNITMEDVHRVNRRMVDLIEEKMLILLEEELGERKGQAPVFPVFAQTIFCPHRKEDDCFCRKPRPGLLYAGASKMGLDLRECLMIGDQPTDVQTAKAANCPAFKVVEGLGDWDPRQLEKL